MASKRYVAAGKQRLLSQFYQGPRAASGLEAQVWRRVHGCSAGMAQGAGGQGDLPGADGTQTMRRPIHPGEG
jgi:hypothetical protein